MAEQVSKNTSDIGRFWNTMIRMVAVSIRLRLMVRMQADCRMEVLAVHAAMQGADRESVCRIMQCLNTTEALKTIRQLGILEQVMASVMERIDFYLSGRAGGEFEIGAIMFSNEDGILGKTPNAEQLLEQIQNERKQK